MNELFIAKKHEVFVYGLREGTSSSFYLKEGERNILPERISYSNAGIRNIQNKGRALTEKRIGQVTATFINDENSFYKQYKPFRLISSVWEAHTYPLFQGYGDIGTSNKEGRIESCNDLFVICKPHNDILEIHLFRSLLDYKEEALGYLDRFIKEQALKRAC